MSAPDGGGGKYGPIHAAHTRIKAEMDDIAQRKARKNHPLTKEVPSAALEVTDKGMSRVLWATTPLTVETSKVPPATSSQQPSIRAEEQQAHSAEERQQRPDQPEKQPPRRGRPVPRPSFALHGMAPGGTVTHTVSGRMRAVRIQSEPSSFAAEATGTIRQANPLREAADRLFEKKAEKPKAAPEKVVTEKDGSDGIER